MAIAVYDPRLSIQQALNQNYTRLILVDASAETQISVALRLIKTFLNPTGFYDYDLSITSTTALSLPCDTGNNGTYYSNACATTIMLQIPTFRRTTLEEVEKLKFESAMAIAGAYFSFVQIISWVVSGLFLVK
jgi:hypothetical protein